MDAYFWVIETRGGRTIPEFDEKTGARNNWRAIDRGRVAKVTFKPPDASMSERAYFLDPGSGEKLSRIFTRVYSKLGPNGRRDLCIRCAATTHAKLWVYPDGTAFVTGPNYEHYVDP